MIWLLLLLLALPLLYIYVIKPHQYWKQVGVKQYNSYPLPIFGDNFAWLSGKISLAEFMQNIYSRMSGVRYLGIYTFYLPVLVIKDPELIKQVLVKDFDHFLDHLSFIPPESDPLWGNNLFALTGQKWKTMRATVSPTFTTSKMKVMFSLMNEAAENFTNYFVDQNKDFFTLELKNTFSKLTTDIIATTAFGLKVDSLRDPNNDFYLMGKEVTDFSSVWKNLKIFAYVLIPKLYKVFSIQIFHPKIANFFRATIKQTIQVRQREGIVRPDMIHILMEAQKGNPKSEELEKELPDTGFATVQESEIGKTKTSIKITDEDITAQAVAFFFAGFDSVSGLMSFTSYELAIRQDCQDRLREEIRQTLKECGGKLTYEGLLKMKYMDMVISESLRKWPNAVATDRVCTKPYTIEPTSPDEKPVHLKCKDSVWVPIFALQRDPEYFPDPDKFDPERFSDENKGNIVPYTYLPFGVGPRNCIGSRFAILEVKSMLFHLLSRFKIVPVEKTEIPLVISKRSAGISAQNGFWFGFEKL